MWGARVVGSMRINLGCIKAMGGCMLVICLAIFC